MIAVIEQLGTGRKMVNSVERVGDVETVEKQQRAVAVAPVAAAAAVVVVVVAAAVVGHSGILG